MEPDEIVSCPVCGSAFSDEWAEDIKSYINQVKAHTRYHRQALEEAETLARQAHILSQEEANPQIRELLDQLVSRLGELGQEVEDPFPQ